MLDNCIGPGCLIRCRRCACCLPKDLSAKIFLAGRQRTLIGVVKPLSRRAACGRNQCSPGTMCIAARASIVRGSSAPRNCSRIATASDSNCRLSSRASARAPNSLQRAARPLQSRSLRSARRRSPRGMAAACLCRDSATRDAGCSRAGSDRRQTPCEPRRDRGKSRCPCCAA